MLDGAPGVGVGPVVALMVAAGSPSRLKYVVPPLAGIAGLKFTVPESVLPEMFENVDVGP